MQHSFGTTVSAFNIHTTFKVFSGGDGTSQGTGSLPSTSAGNVPSSSTGGVPSTSAGTPTMFGGASTPATGLNGGSGANQNSTFNLNLDESVGGNSTFQQQPTPSANRQYNMYNQVLVYNVSNEPGPNLAPIRLINTSQSHCNILAPIRNPRNNG